MCTNTLYLKTLANAVVAVLVRQILEITIDGLFEAATATIKVNTAQAGGTLTLV